MCWPCCCSPYIAVTADMEEFIKDYITEANKEIELFNRQLELQAQPDLFDPWWNLSVCPLPPFVLFKGTTVGGTGRAQGSCTKHSTRMVNVCSHHMCLQEPLHPFIIYVLCHFDSWFGESRWAFKQWHHASKASHVTAVCLTLFCHTAACTVSSVLSWVSFIK